jgi:hypothetical protein
VSIQARPAGCALPGGSSEVSYTAAVAPTRRPTGRQIPSPATAFLTNGDSATGRGSAESKVRVNGVGGLVGMTVEDVAVIDGRTVIVGGVAGRAAELGTSADGLAAPHDTSAKLSNVDKLAKIIRALRRDGTEVISPH